MTLTAGDTAPGAHLPNAGANEIVHTMNIDKPTMLQPHVKALVLRVLPPKIYIPTDLTHNPVKVLSKIRFPATPNVPCMPHYFISE